jgi:hypothetical protein
MSVNNPATPTEGAVWNEQELFEHFLTMNLREYDAFGNILRENETIVHLSDPGGYGTVEDIYEQIIDDLGNDHEPEERLNYLIMDLEGYISGLGQVHAAFRSLKQLQIIVPPEPDETADRATWEEWDSAAYEAENNPRFRPIATETALSGEAA